MNCTKYSSFLIILFVLTFNAKATHLEISEGSDRDICKQIYSKRISIDVNDTKNYGRRADVMKLKKTLDLISETDDKLKWKEGFIQVKGTSKNYKEERVPYLEFDIDNDGNDELVLSFFSWSSQIPGEYYRVLDEKIALDGTQKYIWKDIYSWPGLYSTGNWAYKKHGLYQLEIYPIKVSGTYYLGLIDIYFGSSDSMDRSAVIAKYSDEMISSDSEWDVTSNIEVVCQFMYVK